MKFVVFWVISASIVAGLEVNSAEFLETGLPEEYVPNPEGYLENALDMIWVIFANAFEDPDDLDFVYESAFGCSSNIESIVQEYVDDWPDYCSISRPSYLFMTILQELLAESQDATDQLGEDEEKSSSTSSEGTQGSSSNINVSVDINAKEATINTNEAVINAENVVIVSEEEVYIATFEEIIAGFEDLCRL